MRGRIILYIFTIFPSLNLPAQENAQVIPANVTVNKGIRPNQKAEPLTGTVNGYKGIWFTLGQEKPEYGDKYSGGFATYTCKHIPLAVYSKDADKTFFVYGGTTEANQRYLLCMAGCFDHRTGKLRKPVIVHDKGCYGVSDPHDNPCINIDKDGYLWVFVSGRGNTRKGIRFRSSKPYDISEWIYVNESIMAYPQVIYDKQKGFFLFDTRYDGVRRTFFQTSEDGVNWSGYYPIASIMEPGEKYSGHYQFSNYDGEKLAVCFNRHINGDCDTRTNIYYLQSSDWGKTWTTADGHTKVNLPITREEGPALIHNYHKERRNCYIKDINFDKHGNPIIYYVTSNNCLPGPKGGKRLHHIIRWNGERWIINAFALSTHSYDSGCLCIDGDEWTIIAPTEPGPQRWGAGGEMAMWKSQDGGRTWVKEKNLTFDSPRNHGYARRPLNANNGFYAFWADGNPEKMSKSCLYFCDKQGHVFKMPYDMNEEWEYPERVFTEEPYGN